MQMIIKFITRGFYNFKNSSMEKITQVNLSGKYLVEMGSSLGKGSTGSVYQGRDLINHAKVAVKVIELSTIDNQVTNYLLNMQKKALMLLDSPYVLRGLKIWQDSRFCFMVTEYCNGGTLKDLIEKNGKLSEERSFSILHKILQGYQHLVEKGVVHRDLKPANIMMHDGSPKIIDFGYCQIEGFPKPDLEYNVGSPSYMAPECFQLNLYNQKTEIWAMGVILFQCITGHTIDEGRKMEDTFKQMEEFGIPFPSHVSVKAKKFIKKCLDFRGGLRPTCLELIKDLESLIGNSDKNNLKETTKIYQFLGKENKGKEKDRKINKDNQLFLTTRLRRNQTDLLIKKGEGKYQMIGREFTEHRNRSCYSNYIKPHSSNQLFFQNDHRMHNVQNFERRIPMEQKHRWDYWNINSPGSVHLEKPHVHAQTSRDLPRPTTNLYPPMQDLFCKHITKPLF